MSKFKIGDKVKIPTRKSVLGRIDEFEKELLDKNYTCDYLIVETVDKYEYITLSFNIRQTLFHHAFLESDLEPYEEEMTIPTTMELLGLTEPNNVKSNNEEGEKGTYEWTHDLNADSKCDIWKRLIFAYADENDYNAVKEIAALAEKLK